MVVDFNYHSFFLILNERDFVPPALEKQVTFFRESIGSAHCKFPLEVIASLARVTSFFVEREG
jgi:hypothetical protein